MKEVNAPEGFTFTHCMTCRGPAWRAADGEVFCGECEARAVKLQTLLAQIRVPDFQCLKSALLGTTINSRFVET